MADQQEVALSPIQEFQKVIAEKKTAIGSRLPAHMAHLADRITKIAIMSAIKNPAILECKRESVIMSIMQAAELGLEPGGALGEGYLVPYSVKGVKTCQFIPGYRGLISLARRSGQIVSIEAHLVREGDEFDFELGLAPKLVHKPNLSEPTSKNIRAAYAVARLVGGGVQYEMMLKAEVDAIRARSKSGDFGPWSTDYGEMARKTVVRRLFKYLPVSVEMTKALELDNEDSRELDTSLEITPEAQVVDDANARAQAAADERAKA
jgi:recombination protein RecT